MKTISIVWHTDDVQIVRPDLNEEQAYEVLLHAKVTHDANYGICWDTLRSSAHYLYPETEKAEE